MKLKPPRPLVPALVAGLLAVAFVMDSRTPLGYAVWAFYLVPIALTLLQPRPWLPLLAAALSTVLTAIGYSLSPPGINPVLALINRTIAVSTFWTLAATICYVLTTRRRMHALLEQQRGETAIARALQGEQTLAQVAASAASALVEATGAQIGAVFRRDGDRLQLAGGHALDPERMTTQWTLPNGLPGQVAHDGRARIVTDAPADHLSVSSALRQSAPSHLIVAPIHEDASISGVVEIGFVGHEGDLDDELALVEAVSGSIGAALRTAVFRERLVALLRETQRQSQELQAQQEELRVSNEELEEQGRVLADSHTQLEAQQAELEQSNVQLEEQKESLERQKHYLVQAQSTLRLNAEQLEEASRYKSEFLANMSHELRTPLNSALILSKLLADNREGTLTAEQVKYALAIHASNNDLLALINDVLDLSKIEAGHVDLAPEAFALGDLLQRLRSVFEPLAAQKSITLTFDVAPGAPERLVTDPMRLQQVLKNLLANAVKFTERGGVRLRIHALPGERVAFDVSDTGLGIAKAQQEIIFEAFRQADGSTSRRFGGTGLGLSISRELARRLGGEIRVDSEPGRGSTFTLDIPGHWDEARITESTTQIATQRAVAATSAATSASTSAASFAATAPASMKSLATPPDAAAAIPDVVPAARQHPGRLILAVEDDPVFAGLLCDLAREMGFDAASAATGEAALRLARDLQPNGILLDVGLPDQSGLGVLERLKRDPLTRHIPVHVVSAHPHVQTARELGAVGYLQKPATRDELQQVMLKLQERLQQKMRRLLIVEDDAALRANLELLLGDEQVHITAVGTIAEALQLLSTASFDCMVTDLTLPDGTGYELLERISSGDQYAFPPVIVYTGRALSREEEQRLRRYSSSIIVKGARSPERLLDEVTLFLHSVESSLPANKQSLLRQARQRDAVLDGRRILIAEDDVRNIFALSSIFEPLGARLEIARNGREAIDKLHADPDIDLVLMDVMMPEMDGLTAMRLIRERREWAALPVIALTAKAMPNDREECLQAGASDYIAKPIDVDRLVSLCRVWMPK